MVLTQDTEWQYHVINVIKAYEATKSKQHPVGMTVTYPGGANAAAIENGYGKAF